MATAKEALDWLGVRSPDLALLGLKLGDAHGLDLVARLRDDEPDVPIVVLATGATDRDLFQAHIVGANDVVLVPCPPGELFARSVRHLGVGATPRPGQRALAPRARHSELHVDDEGLVFGRYVPSSVREAFVVQAWDVVTDREVALKLLRREASDEPRRRFHDEARHLAAISHPNVARLVDRGQHGDVAYFALELVHGPTLDSHVREHGPLCEAQVLRLLGGLVSALVALHVDGMVHRDLKPANILLEGSDVARPVLIDFGLVRRLSDPSLTDPAFVIDTPAYIAPEVAEGAAADARSDLYSLGLVAVFALTAREPRGELCQEADLAALAAPIVVPEGVSSALRIVLHGLTHRDPTWRPRSAAEALSLLTLIDGGRASTAVSAGDHQV